MTVTRCRSGLDGRFRLVRLLRRLLWEVGLLFGVPINGAAGRQ